MREKASDGTKLLAGLGFQNIAFALTDDAKELGDNSLTFNLRAALFFGAEGDGLSRETIDTCDLAVKIPMSGGVDSLNVAAASAVAFWEFRKK